MNGSSQVGEQETGAGKPATAASLGRLERVSLRDVWPSESGDFTPWLAREENIELLGEAIGLELEVEAQEKNVGPFRADILCKDTATSDWVLVENQLERTDHVHLGQLLTYASGLHAVTIVWIAERFTDEHRAALDWLNEVTSEKINFFGLEIELWRIGNSLAAPKFNVVSQPNDWTRTVVEARQQASSGELTSSGQRILAFWTAFVTRIEERGNPIRAPKPNADYWKNYALGRSGFTIMAIIGFRDKWVGMQVSLNDAHAKRYFQMLEARRNEIEAALGTPLEWRELPERKESQIRLARTGVDPTDESQWPELHDWLIDKIVLFKQKLSPIVKELELPEIPSDASTE